jgi:hypothetical protein
MWRPGFQAEAGREPVPKFKLGDLVKIAEPQTGTQYTGRVLGLIEEPIGATYTIELKQTGWIGTFTESDLEPIELSSAATA